MVKVRGGRAASLPARPPPVPLCYAQSAATSFATNDAS